MTTTIMTRPAARTTVAATTPEYWCAPCGTFHTGRCATVADRQLGDLLARMVRDADARIPQKRRARRTLQEMMLPGYERQPVLTLYRPVMADDACPVCGRWSCKGGSDCPPGAAPAPAASVSGPVVTGGGWQCDRCGVWFGVTAELPAPATVRPASATAWTCSACSALGQ